MKIGVIGCGNISPLYLAASQYFDNLEFVVLADLNMDLAKSRAKEFGIDKVLGVSELLELDEIDIVLNLTVPKAHAQISKDALLAGKHVYSEKPITINLKEAQELVKITQKTGKRLAVAPSTFLGATVQTARKAIDDGLIGKPIAANCFMLHHGMESWHPNPEFFYQSGAGPMLDMGPYYLAALVTLFGPVSRLSAAAVIGFAQRQVEIGEKAGNSFSVTTPTHINTNLEFASGVLANLNTSFDVWHSELPKFEIYGTEGTLSLEAPNSFDGKVKIKKAKDKDWQELEFVTQARTLKQAWGIALADFVTAIEQNYEHRASAEMGLHLYEIMQSSLDSAEQARYISLKSTCKKPEPLL